MGSYSDVTNLSSSSKVYWLPAIYNQDSKDFRKTCLLPCLNGIAQKAGFRVVTGCSVKRSKSFYVVRVICDRGCVSRPKGSTKSRQTNRPTASSGRCPFYFNVYFSSKYQRWFIRRSGGGCSEHRGHCKQV